VELTFPFYAIHDLALSTGVAGFQLQRFGSRLPIKQETQLHSCVFDNWVGVREKQVADYRTARIASSAKF
jgi:hypothetical protein